MGIYLVRVTQTIVTGYTYEVKADSDDDAYDKYTAGAEDYDGWESGYSECVKSHVDEVESPDGTVSVYGPTE